jgi:hypothetical protein
MDFSHGAIFSQRLKVERFFGQLDYKKGVENDLLSYDAHLRSDRRPGTVGRRHGFPRRLRRH